MSIEKLTPGCDHPSSEQYTVGEVSWCNWCLLEMEHREPDKGNIVRKRIETAKVQVKLQTRYKTAMLTPRFMDKSFDNFKCSTEHQAIVFNKAKQYADDFDGINHDLVMIGNTGTGKDHLATAIAKTLIDRGRTVLYSDAEKLHRRIRDGYRIEKEPEQKTMDAYAGVDLLVVNELGIRTSDALTGMLTEISNDRVNNRKNTVWIGNLSIKMFEDKLGDRAFDRIVRKDKSNVLVFDWGSYRP